jgi:hypothetical protein
MKDKRRKQKEQHETKKRELRDKLKRQLDILEEKCDNKKCKKQVA